MAAGVPLDRRKIGRFCRKWQISELALFGSVLRDDFRPKSDVDVLVEYAPGVRHSLDDLLRMEDEASALFGRKVDVVERAAVERSENYIRREHILGSARVVDRAGGKRSKAEPRAGAGEQAVPVMRRDEAYLLDMLSHARGLQEHLGGVSAEEFAASELLQGGTIFLVERIDRAARKVPAEIGAAHPEIAWERLTSMEKRLEDEHFRIDVAGLWTTARDEIRRLIGLLEPLRPPAAWRPPKTHGRRKFGIV